MKYQQLVAMPASVQDWLDHELEMRGIDAVVYTRYILSILLQQDNFDSETGDRELFPAVAKRNLKETPVSKSKGKSKLRAERNKSLNCEEMKKSAAVECLMSVSEQKCGIEKLVDELCDKLKNIQGAPTTAIKTDQTVELYEQEPRPTILEKTTGSLASSSPQEQAEKYYAAFPALSGNLEPSEKPEAQPPLDTMALSVWESKKATQKVKLEEEGDKKNGSDVIDDRANEEKNDGKKVDGKDEKKVDGKDEKVEDKKIDIPEDNNKSLSKQVHSNNSNNSKGYFKMKVELETLEKSIGSGSIKSYVETWGNKVAQEAAFVKPSFIVPKCRTSGTRRHHPKMAVVKGKSPFTLAKPKVSELPTVRHVRKKVCNSTVKSRFPPVMRQHSEENTEESSSLDNSFDEDGEHSTKSNSRSESDRYITAAGARKDGGPNKKWPSVNSDSDGCIAGGEAEVLAKLAAKFNDRVAAIWSDQKLSGDVGRPSYHKAASMTDNIWQVLPFYGCVGSSGQQQLEPPLTPPVVSGFFPHDLKNLFGGSLASDAVRLPVVTSESCSVWLNPLSERPSSPGGSVRASSPFVLGGGKGGTVGHSPITAKDGQEVDTFGIAVPESQTSYNNQVYEDLMKNSLWPWQADRPFIQGGVYGSASEFPEAPWRLMRGGAAPISLADLDANGCSTPSSTSSEQDSLLESEPESPKCSTPSHNDEMQLVWEILGKLGNTIQDESGEPSPVGNLPSPPLGDADGRGTMTGFGDGFFGSDRQNSWQQNDGADLGVESYLDHLWRPPLSQPSNETSPCQLMKLEDTLIDLKAIWNSMHSQEEREDLVAGGGVQIHVLTPHYALATSDDAVENQSDWSGGLSDQLLGPPLPPMEPGSVSLTRSYDSYLNKVLREKSSENGDGLSGGDTVDNGEFVGNNIFRSEPSLFTYHKGESRFVEVKPMSKETRMSRSMVPSCPHPLPLSSQPPLDMLSYQHIVDGYESDAHENLLTSPKTHFRPIRQDSCETDTTVSSEAGEEHTTVGVSSTAAGASDTTKPCGDKKMKFECRGLPTVPHVDEDGDDSSDELAFLALGCSKKGNSEKFCQTEESTNLQDLGHFLSPPIQCSSGVDPKEEEDACTQILNAVIDVLDTMLNTRGILEESIGGSNEEACRLEDDDDDDDEGDDEDGDLSDSSSTSLSPVSSKIDSGGSVSELDVASSASGLLHNIASAQSVPSGYEFGNPLYRKPEQDPWGASLEADLLARNNDPHVETSRGAALLKWSTAQEEHPFWMEEGEENNNNCTNNPISHGNDRWNTVREKTSPCSGSTGSSDVAGLKEKVIASDDEVGQGQGVMTKVKSLRDEIKEEEEQLFEDIDQLRILGLDEGAWDDGGLKDRRADWLLPDLAVGSVMDEAAEEDVSAELEMINKRRLAGSSCDGDDDEERAAFADGILYSDYFFELQNADDMSGVKLPVVPTSKALYSTDLEEEWRKTGKPFDVQVPKNKCISKQKDYSQKRPCSFYLEGNCRRSDCKFSHDLASITCRFWEDGSCFKGITCPFLHGYRSTADKENTGEKSGFQLELESEAHFPTLGKPKLHIRKQDLCHSSSSDSMPMTQNRRRRKRCPGRQRVSSPNGQVPLVKCAKPNRHQQLVLRKKPSKASSSEEDTMDI